MPGIGCTNMPGASIRDITEKVKQETKKMEDGMLIVQGRGNQLQENGVDATVKEIMDAVMSAEKKTNVAVVGILRQPQESMEYERLRRGTNKRLCEEIVMIKMKWMTEKSGNMSFLDLDKTLGEDQFYARDGVHLNADSNARMGARLQEWVKARTVCCVDLI